MPYWTNAKNFWITGFLIIFQKKRQFAQFIINFIFQWSFFDMQNFQWHANSEPFLRKSFSQNFDTPKKIVCSCWKPKGLQSWVVISVISGTYLQKCVRQSLLFGSEALWQEDTYSSITLTYWIIVYEGILLIEWMGL